MVGLDRFALKLFSAIAPCIALLSDIRVTTNTFQYFLNTPQGGTEVHEGQIVDQSIMSRLLSATAPCTRNR